MATTAAKSGTKMNWTKVGEFALAVTIGMVVFTLINKHVISKMDNMLGA